MAEVKWIKITTDIFADEKILLIESLPEADTIITIWFKLLCLAGRQNNSGVFISNNMPYTEEMFATIFRRPLNIVKLALQTFENFGMVEIVNNVYTIPNWEKHQSLDAYEQKKLRDREYQADRRAKQKLIASGKSYDNRVTSNDNRSLDKDIDIDIDIDNKKKILKKEYLHLGCFSNVKLTTEEYEKLKQKYPTSYEDKIDKLSMYISSKGDKYKSHYATILNWTRKEEDESRSKEPSRELGYAIPTGKVYR